MKFKKITSVILVLSFVLSSIPAVYYAESNNTDIEPPINEPIIDENNGLYIESIDYGKILDYVDNDDFYSNNFECRVPSAEELNSYVFQDAEGQQTAYIFSENVKFVDTDGNIVDKDITLIETENGYTTTANDVSLILSYSLSDGIIIGYNGYSVKTSPKGITEGTISEIKDNAVTYTDALGAGLSLRYTPLLSGVKEDIILSQNPNVQSFDFTIQADELSLINGNGKFAFIGNDGNTVFEVGSLFIYDANGKEGQGNLEIVQTDTVGVYTVTIVPDIDFLSDETTAYPVTIDPTITVSDTTHGTNSIIDAVIYSGYPNNNFGTTYYNMVGTVSTYGIGRTVVKFPGLTGLSTYNSITANQITSVQFFAKECSGGSSQYINLYPLVSNTTWTETGVTWNNVGTYTTALNCGTTVTGATENTFDITNLVKGWKNGTYSADAGFILISSNESEQKGFCSSESSYKPYVIMTYTPTISISGAPLAVNEGTMFALTATTHPSGLEVTWSSNNGAAASVTGDGIVTAYAAKSSAVTITASVTVDGNTYSASCMFHVIIADGVYYIKNQNSNYYLHIDEGGISSFTDVKQFAKYSSATSNVSKIRQMWKIRYLGNGKYSVRPLHKLDMGLDVTDGNVDILNIGTIDMYSNVLSDCRWSIGRYSNPATGLIFQSNGSSSKTMQVENASTNINASVIADDYDTSTNCRWTLEAVTSPPSGVILYDTSTGLYISAATRYVAPEDTASLANFHIVAAFYSGSTIDQTVTWSSSDTDVATVDSNTGAVTGISPGTVTITATKTVSGNSYTASYTVEVTAIANGTYFLKNKQNSNFARVKNGTMTNDQNAVQYDLDGTNYERWIFTLNRFTGYYSIKSVASSSPSYYLAVEGDSTALDHQIVIHSALESTLTDGMKWKVESTPSGAYKIIPKTGELNDYVLAASTYLGTNNVNLIQGDYILNSSYLDEWYCVRMLPTNGYELSYDPTLWSGAPSANNNCYAYALNNQIYEPGNNTIWFKQQPGEYYNRHKENNPAIPQGYQYPASIIVSSVQFDFDKYNLVNGTGLSFTPIGRYDSCPAGTYKVALVVSNSDYHWYRQDSDGLWSHKQGTYPVQRTDNSGDLIVDPMIANRGAYSTFVGFFAVKPWNNMYTSSKSNETSESVSLEKIIDDRLLNKIVVGMDYSSVITILGDKGVDVGSGTIIQQYLSSEKLWYTFEYISTDDNFIVSNIIIRKG